MSNGDKNDGPDKPKLSQAASEHSWMICNPEDFVDREQYEVWVAALATLEEYGSLAALASFLHADKPVKAPVARALARILFGEWPSPGLPITTKCLNGIVFGGPESAGYHVRVEVVAAKKRPPDIHRWFKLDEAAFSVQALMKEGTRRQAALKQVERETKIAIGFIRRRLQDLEALDQFEHD
jgi:hypothetical protein